MGYFLPGILQKWDFFYELVCQKDLKKELLDLKEIFSNMPGEEFVVLVWIWNTVWVQDLDFLHDRAKDTNFSHRGQ